MTISSAGSPIFRIPWKVSWVIYNSLSVFPSWKWRGELPHKLTGIDHNPTMECVPCCPIDRCSLGANPWSTGWFDDNRPRWRPEDGWLGVGCWQSLVVCWVRKGQSKLMGSVHCTRIPFILATINQSHCSPLLVLYSADPLVDLKTHIGTSTNVLFLCHDSHNPLCSWI